MHDMIINLLKLLHLELIHHNLPSYIPYKFTVKKNYFLSNKGSASTSGKICESSHCNISMYAPFKMAAGVIWFVAVAPPVANSEPALSFSKLRDNHCLVSSKPSILDSVKHVIKYFSNQDTDNH